MHVFELAPYNGSRDYARLAELAKQKSIICIVDYQDMRDVAHTIYSEFGDKGTWQLSARGTTYLYANSAEEFAKRCARHNVEFIEPAA